MNTKKILISPLDWGLGHASRCVPIIKALINRNHEIILAGNGASFHYLSKAFPELKTYSLPGHEIKYGRGYFKWMKLLWQIPAYLRNIKKENHALSEIIKHEDIDAVISDNRYGLWNPTIPCILITHQLHPRSPILNSILFGLINYYSRKKISVFNECWIPDFEESPGMAGSLSHPPFSGIKTKYIGPLSRFEKITLSNSIKTYQILAILSGPEPQRSLFEESIIQHCLQHSLTLALVRGLPVSENIRQLETGSISYNHCTDAEIINLINQSEYIISRSGYSSIMDMHILGKKAIMISTPGQSEQEYLAKILVMQKKAIIQSQDRMNLPLAMRQMNQLPEIFVTDKGSLLEQAIIELEKQI